MTWQVSFQRLLVDWAVPLAGKRLAKTPSERYQDAAGLMKSLEVCSVAGVWGAEQAAHWWGTVVGKTQGHVGPEVNRTVEATMDYNPSEP